MRHLTTLASVIALIAATGMSMRYYGRQLPWLVTAYLAAQCLFTLIAWWGIQRDSLDSVSYMRFFGVVFALVLVFAISFAVKIAFIHPRVLGIWLLLGSLFQSSAFAAIVSLELAKTYRVVPAQLQMAVFQGFVLCFCGAVTLIALATNLHPEMRFAVTALGLFWTALGLLAFCWALGIGRNRGMWLHLNNFLPAMMAVVAFGWLAFQLSNLQAEGSRQEVTQHSGAQVTR